MMHVEPTIHRPAVLCRSRAVVGVTLPLISWVSLLRERVAIAALATAVLGGTSRVGAQTNDGYVGVFGDATGTIRGSRSEFDSRVVSRWRSAMKLGSGPRSNPRPSGTSRSTKRGV